jgi:hypothetical protein
VLNDPPIGAVLVALSGVGDQAGDRARTRADPLDGLDLLLEGEDRLDLQGRAEPRPGCADPAAAAQVLERVHREPELQRLAGLVGGLRG